MRSALTPHIRLRSQAYLILRAVECLTIVAIRGYFLTSRTHRNTSVLPVYAVSGAGGLILSSALWTSRLVPRTVSMLGLLGYPVFLVGTVLAMFGLIHVTHGAGMDALVPVASSSRSSRSGSSPKDSPPRGSQMMGPRTVRSTRQPRLTLSLPERLGASGPNPSHESASPRSLGERKPPFRVASVCLHEVVDREAGTSVPLRCWHATLVVVHVTPALRISGLGPGWRPHRHRGQRLRHPIRGGCRTNAGRCDGLTSACRAVAGVERDLASLVEKRKPRARFSTRLLLAGSSFVI